MSLNQWVGAVIVLAFCGFLFWLAALILVRREKAKSFLEQYGSSARAHYLEQLGRLIAGVGIVLFAPRMWYSELLGYFGWLLVITSVGLMLIPWQWHHKFAKLVVPPTIRFILFYALGAFALGAFLFYSFTRIFH